MDECGKTPPKERSVLILSQDPHLVGYSETDVSAFASVNSDSNDRRSQDETAITLED